VPDESVARYLAILLGLDPEGSVDDREELFFSERVFIESVAREQPTMFVFEDIHWSDRSLLDLIELLAARLRDLPVLFLTLARSYSRHGQAGAEGFPPTARCRSHR
jgi:FixJ family two-component response regulator